MVKITIIQQIEDEKNIYHIGDWVRVLMKPKHPERPRLASEFIGEIIDISATTFTLDCIIDNAEIDICKIDKMRFADKTEDFDNTPYFDGK